MKQTLALFFATLTRKKTRKENTMKKTLLALILMVAVIAIFAQNPVAKGQTQFNVGFGLSSWGVPVYAGLDYGIHKDWTMGGEVSFRSYKYKDYDHSIIGILGNANYHLNHVLNIPLNWDLYVGPNIGFNMWNSPSDYDGTGVYRSGLGFGAQIGGRYYFSDKVGVNLEFGGGNAFSSGKFGLSFKL